MTSTDGVDISRDGSVLRVTLDRPSHKNALTPPLVRTMVTAIEEAAIDDEVRAVLLRSSGPDFCTGADIVAANPSGHERPRPGNVQRRTALQAHRLIEVLTSVQIPVVASVRGWAAGLGCQLALAADFAIVAHTATLWEPFVSRGFTPDSGATWLLPRLVGLTRAKELLLLGEQIDGTTAAAWGLVHRAVPDAELDDATDALVARLAAGPTVALGLTKACLLASTKLDLSEAMAREVLALELAFRTTDFREGVAAFKERRDPTYEGR